MLSNLKKLVQSPVGLKKAPVPEKRRARLVKASNTDAHSKQIHVAIPSTYMRQEVVQAARKIKNIPVGGFSTTQVIFKVEVRRGGSVWQLEKTFDDFQRLHDRICRKFPIFKEMMRSFPKKKYFILPNATRREAIISYRQKWFQLYLQALLQLQPGLVVVYEFLEITRRQDTLEKTEYGLEDFQLLKLLGKGSFGKVFLVRVLGSQELFAMKVLRKAEVKRRKQVEHTKTELRVMGGTSHPFIVSLRYAFQDNSRLFMVSDFCQGGELFFHLKQQKCFSAEQVRFYSAEISLALNYLHENKIIYRDIKPENVLLDDQGHIKITDFGLSIDNVTDPFGAKTFCGTPEYLSPEMLLGKQRGHGYGKSVDWWGLGVLMYEMFFGWPPFYHQNKKVMCRRILKNDLKFNRRTNSNVTREAKDIIRGFLKKEPETRLGCGKRGFDDVKSHKFFEGIDWEMLYRRELEPPFKPSLGSTVGNFDAEFTQEPAKMSMPDSGGKRHSGADDDERDEDDEFSDFNFSSVSPSIFFEVNA